MVIELGLGKLFDGVLQLATTPVPYTSQVTARTAHARNTSPYGSSLKELKDIRITIHHLTSEKQFAKVGTKLLSNNTHRHFLGHIKVYTRK